MNACQLLPGEMLVVGVPTHVAALRRFTSDIERFKKIAPVLEDLEARYEVGSDAFQDAIGTWMGQHPEISVDAVCTTMEEVAAFAMAHADVLTAELQRRKRLTHGRG